MDKNNNHDDDEPKQVQAQNQSQFQSETGRDDRRIQTFLVNSISSPLFYTVSGNNEKLVGSKNYYVEQLGCPSIIKPSFRDLPGCTRLSVGSPLTPYRQYPFDKLNKTIMGKSPPTTSTYGKRIGAGSRGEKFMSPIKVNTKIRHIYSSESSTMSHQTSSFSSSSFSVSTQTQTDQLIENETSPIIQSLDEEAVMDEHDLLLQKDAFTCMTPPPPSPSSFSDNNLLGYSSSIPPAYAGKLEDLEKITGHIVIQRFFTRADEAFGMWLEKQLGMNVKSIGVGQDSCDDENNISSSYPHKSLETFTNTGGIEIGSAKKLRESRILEKIIEVDDILAAEEISVSESLLEKKPSSLSCNMKDCVKCECFLEYFANTDQEESIVMTANVSDLTNFEDQIINQLVNVEIKSGKNEQSLETDLRLQGEDEDEDKVQSTWTCIPDVIHVSQPLQTQSISISQSEETTTTTNEDSEELKTVISNPSMTESQLESQYKVAEYLGKLEISNKDASASTSANSINSELDNAEQVAVEEECLKNKVIIMDGSSSALGDEKDGMKRSISADSCIGTESSGERNMLNDSGSIILLDSGRMDMDIPEEENEITPLTFIPFSASEIENNEEEIAQAVDSSKSVIEYHRPVLSNNQSIDDSTNRSDVSVSSVLKQHHHHHNNIVSDEGGDADQSESNSDSEFIEETDGGNSQQQSQFLMDNNLDLEDTVVDEDDDENEGEQGGSDQDGEPDQFDTIIENHEKEKRLRPIYRKRNVSTQTSKSRNGSSSTVSCCTTDQNSRPTTATSNSSSSFDLEFISTTKKYISHIHSSKQHHHHQMQQTQEKEIGENVVGVGRKRSYLPTGSSGLNILNMKFTMGREFESEVSIRIPPKSPTNSSILSSSSSFNYQNLPNTIIPSSTTSFTNTKKQTTKSNKNANQLPAIIGSSSSQNQQRPPHSHNQNPSSSSTPLKLAPLLQQDPELKSLWKDVKSKMEHRVENDVDLQITGNRMKLITSSSGNDTANNATSTTTTTTTTLRHASRTFVGDNNEQQQDKIETKLPILISSSEQEKLKRSLKRLQRILDD